MAVGDDGWQGGIQYIRNIMHALNEVAGSRDLEIHLFRNASQNFGDLSELRHLKITEHNTDQVFPPWTFANRLKWKLKRKLFGRLNPRLEDHLLKLGVDYVYPATLSACGGRLNAGAWIADFQYHHFPDGARKDVNADAERVISRIAEKADKIVLSSEYCNRDCQKLFPFTKGRTQVMPFAVAISERDIQFENFDLILERYSIPRQFLFVANIFAPTKNHRTLFDALGKLRERGLTVPLVCTGNIVDYRNEAYANEILQMLTRNGIRSQVHLLGLVPRTDQLALFRMSTAIVQPSLNEGWSTSVEEAKALGKHLFVSDIDVHKEQVPSSPFMFEAENALDLADKIEAFWIENIHLAYPDLDHEKQALRKYKENVQVFGERFLSIAEV